MPSDPSRDLYRRFSRKQRSRTSSGRAPEAPPPSVPNAPASQASNPPSLPPLRSYFTRSSSNMSTSGGNGGGRPTRYRAGERFSAERFSERHRPTLDHSRFEDLELNLENANSQLRALLDRTNGDPMLSSLSPPLMSPSYSQDLSEDSRRIKRRKLDSDRPSSSFTGFRYGRYGQVEPGPLTMELVSCDGGIYSEGSAYAAENILKNDDSVYCTKGNRCNIVIRHQGATAFSLQELIIKAPGQNYSAP